MFISGSSQSVLTRSSLGGAAFLTPIQLQVEGLVGHFVQEATNPTTLAAMVAGGLAYRMGRVGAMSMRVGAFGNTPLRIASMAIGLGSEVTAFELTHRTLQTFQTTNQNQSPNLWSWSGPGGWRESLINSLITFGMLKGAGHLAREQNLIFQHAFQSTAMVAGQNTAGLLGIAPGPEGSLAEQFLKAETMAIQLGAGMSLIHGLAPGLGAWERGLDLSLQGEVSWPSLSQEISPPGLVLISTHSGKLEEVAKPTFSPSILLMSSQDKKLGTSDSLPSSSLKKVPSYEEKASEMEFLRDNGWKEPSLLLPYLANVSAQEIVKLGESYPRNMILRALQVSSDPYLTLRRFKRNFGKARWLAEKELGNQPGAKDLARLIANLSFDKKKLVNVVEHHLENWHRAYSVARHTLTGNEDLNAQAWGVALRSFYLMDPILSARKLSLRFVIGLDPSAETIVMRRFSLSNIIDIPSPDPLPNAGATFDSAAKTLADQSLIRAAPVIGEKVALLQWLWENKSKIDLLAGPSRRYSYPQVVKALEQAGCLKGDASEYSSLAGFMEFDYQLALNPSLNEILNPSKSFQKSYHAFRRYFFIRRAQQDRVDREIFDSSQGVSLTLKNLSQFSEVLQKYIASLAPGIKSLQVQVLGGAAQKINLPHWRKLPQPGLQEVRLIFPDGTMKSFRKDPSGKILEQILSSLHPLPQSLIFHSHEVERLRVITPWEGLKEFEPFPQLMIRLRQESDLSLKDVSVLLKLMTGSMSDEHTFGEMEREPHHRLSFKFLQALAKLYGADVRDLIEASNRTRYPDLSPEIWRAPDYPLYLENQSDLERVTYFHEQDRARRTLGWLVFSIPKDPFRYRTTAALSKELGVELRQIQQWELNRNKPQRAILPRLARVLQRDLASLKEAIHSTFDADLLPALDRVFPGRGVYVEPSSADREKILSYAKNLAEEKAPSLGQILFDYRNSLPGSPTMAEMSRRLGKERVYWEIREGNRVELTPFNLSEWMELFRQLGLSFRFFSPHLERYGMGPRHPRYLLAEAMRGGSLEGLSRRAGLDKKILTALLDPTRKVGAKVALNLKKALPELNGPSFYLSLDPSVAEFFPEAKGESPVLFLNKEEILSLPNLNPPGRLFAHRMDHRLEKKQVADRLGVSLSFINEFERSIFKFKKPETLKALADLLTLNPRLVYLYYHPEILEVFPVKDPESGQSLNWDGEEHERWRNQFVRERDSLSLREDLQRQIAERGVSQPDQLSLELGIPKGQAEKMMFLDDALSLDEILLLKRHFPDFSVRRLYEHFHRATLAYFLGRKGDGSIDYELPTDSWESLASLDLYPLVEKAILGKFPSFNQASLSLKMPLLLGAKKIQVGITERSWKEETIAFMANIFGLDRRLLFFYFRGEELRRMLDADRDP